MDLAVQETIAAVEKFIAGHNDANPLPRQAAQFVHALVLATKARHAVEIGTSYGYSGLWIGAALAVNSAAGGSARGGHGRLITIERERRKSDVAATYFGQAGLATMIQVRNGVAAEILATLPEPIDFVLNDADKQFCRQYVELLQPKLSPRAVILTDNVLTHADELAEFLAWLRANKAFVSTPVPVGNGMELTVYLGTDH
jgi:predicted O-methyltransferase YrrM